MASSFVKDPDDVLDFEVDWSAFLGEDDTIADVEWVVPDDLEQPIDPSSTDTTATVWLGGGTAGTRSQVVCRVTTAGGRTRDQTLLLMIRQR